MLHESRTAGENCSRCKAPMARKERMFYWRGSFTPASFANSVRRSGRCAAKKCRR